MLVNKLGVDVSLLMLCRLRFCKSFQSDNYVYHDLNNSTLDFLKATFHLTIFDIPMRPMLEDQRHRRRFTR